MRAVALIPARGGSRGLPRKNLAPLHGHPLIAWTITAARQCPALAEVIVTTDDEEIADVARRYGASVPFLRPSSLARDDSLDLAFFQHYTNFLADRGEALPDVIAHLRPTTPLRQAEEITAALEQLSRFPEATALRSMQRSRVTPYKLFFADNGYAVPCCTLAGTPEAANQPRQALPPAWAPNGVVDLVRPEVFLPTGLLHGEKMLIFETSPRPDVDLAEDLAAAERALDDPTYDALRASLSHAAV